MDEEDLAEVEEARKLKTVNDFSGLGSTEQDSIRKDFLMDLMKPGGETIGTKLLKKMGWREGQGVGPRVRRKARLDNGDADEENTHMFAPENPNGITFSRKDDRKGLGYAEDASLRKHERTKGEDEEGGRDGQDGRLLSQRKTSDKRNNRTGIGVGILNDTGSDDEDPYSVGPNLSYNRTIGGVKKKKA